MNDVIPCAQDLHTLVAPELQAVIVGQDPAFQENRGTMQRYAEGMLLRTFLLIAQANQMEGRDILTVLTEKLKNLELGIAELQGKNDEEIARHMIDRLIGNIIGVVSKDDFKGIPLPLQKMAYDKLKEVAYQHATPYLLLMIEKTRAALEKASGSPFLGNLSHAISRDIFKLIPTLVSSYKPIAAEIHSLLYDQSATQVQIDQMAEKIAALVEKSDKVKLTNQAILEAFIKADDLNAEKLKALKIKLREKGVKQKINNIIIAPEEIVALIKESLLPQMPAQLQAALAKEIQNFTHDKPVVYKNISEFAQGYVEGVLLNAFMGMAKKNPPDQDKHKDSMLVAMEKLFDLAEIKFKEMRTRPFDEIAQAFEKEVMESIFGIHSPEAFKGLPPPLQTKIFDLLKNKLAGTLISVQQSLKNLENGSDEVQAAKAGLREDKFGPLKEGKANGEILAEDIANYALSIIPETLTEANGNAKDLKIINKISKGVEEYLEDLAESNLKLAKVLLDYAQAPQYQKILSEKLINIANTHQPIQNKQKAVEMVSNLIVMPLNRILQAAFKLEEQNGEEVDTIN